MLNKQSKTKKTTHKVREDICNAYTQENTSTENIKELQINVEKAAPH